MDSSARIECALLMLRIRELVLAQLSDLTQLPAFLTDPVNFIRNAESALTAGKQLLSTDECLELAILLLSETEQRLAGQENSTEQSEKHLPERPLRRVFSGTFTDRRL